MTSNSTESSVDVKSAKKTKKKPSSESNSTTTEEEEEGTVFVFYSESKDKPPGEGVGEHIDSKDKKRFKTLSNIEDWRKRLSNFDISPFEEDGKTWNSVEHYYQASKFKKDNKKFYKKFSADANTNLSRDPAMAKAAGSKSGKYEGKRIRPEEVTIDSDFFKGRDVKVMNKAQEAKFFSHPDLMNILKATKHATLVHMNGKDGKKIVFQHLMDIRDGKVKKKDKPEEIVLTTKVSKSAPNVSTKFVKKKKEEAKFPEPSNEDRLAGHFVPKLVKRKAWNDVYEKFEDFSDYGIEGNVSKFYSDHGIELIPSISAKDRKNIPKITLQYDKPFDKRRINPKPGSGIKPYRLDEMKEFIAVKHVRVPTEVKTVDQHRKFLEKNVKLFL